MQDHHPFLIRMIRSGCLVDLHHQCLVAVKRNQHDILDALEYMIDTDEK